MPEISTSVSSKVNYYKTGRGPALVLIHGFPESSSLWRNVVQPLALSYTVIAPDLPGSGRSLLQQKTSIAQMADCVAAIMDNEQIEKAVIAGHSMGGYVGFAFAAAYPARLAGLSVVHSTPVADDEDRKKMRQKTIALIQNGGREAFVRQMIPALFSEEFRATHPDKVQEQTELGMELDDESLINYYEAMIGREDHVKLLSALNTPLQWVIGMHDNPVFYKNNLGFLYKSQINFVTFYKNSGHMSMLEAPEQLVHDLKAFADYCYERPK